MQTCERCNAEADGYELFDYCAECSRNLCPACMAKGCCGHIPAKSGMEADGHTPGPWVADPPDATGDVPVIADGTKNPTRGLVAVATWRHGRQAEAVANAALIAASPDLLADNARLRAALEALRKTAVLLLQQAEGCAVNHYGSDFAEQGMPGWLVDARADVEAATEALKDQQP